MASIQALDPALSPFCRAAYDLSKESFADTDPIGTLTDRAARGLALNLTAAGSVRPTFIANQLNGYGIARFDGTDDALAASAAADWKWLSDGHGITLIALVKQGDSNPDRLNALVDTCAASSSNIGLAWWLDDRSGSSRNDTVSSLMGKGGGVGGLQWNVTPSNGRIRTQGWQYHTLRYACESNEVDNYSADANDVVLSCDGLGMGGANAGNLPHTTSNPTYALSVGKINAGSFWLKGDLAGLWMFDIALSDEQLAAHYRWLEQRFDVYIARPVSRRGGQNSFPGLARRADGILLAASQASFKHDPGGIPQQALVVQRSGDRGCTWSLPESVASHATQDTRGGGIHVFAGTGTVVVCGWFDDGTATGLFPRLWRSTDGGRTWSSAITPTHGFTSWGAIQSGFCELSNGYCLVPVYGKFTGDTFSSTRTILTTDDGATWGSAVQLTTANTKNWNECSLVKLSGTYPNETLLALIRNDTDSRIDKCTSTDSGATWGAITSAVTGMGGNPLCLKLASGNLLLLCRDRTSPAQAMARWSSDSGTTWSASNYRIAPVPGFSAYSAGIELSAARILVVSAHETTTQSSNPTMSLMFAQIHREADILTYT